MNRLCGPSFGCLATALFLFLLLGMTPQTSLAAGDTLVIGLLGDATSMDPHAVAEATNEMITNHIFDRLLRLEDDMSLGPGLAKTWKLIDAVTWEFKLHQGVKFTNGEPVNAAAAKFSLERAATHPKSQAKSWVPVYKEIKVIDEYTLHLITKTPNPDAVLMLREVAILPPKYYAKWDAENYGRLSTEPVGAGPYKLVKWVKDDYVELVKNPDWPLDKVEFDRIIFKPIPQDSTRLAALISGEVDIAQNITISDIPRVQNSPNLHLSRCPSLRGIFIAFDVHTDKGGPGPDMQPGIEAGKPNPFKDIRVRKAVAHAINVDDIIKYVMEGSAQPATQILIDAVPGSNPKLTRFKHDPELAKKLLREAGYPNGFGFKVNFDVPNDRYINDKQIGEAIVSQLAKVGIKLTLVDAPKAVFFPKIWAYQSPMCMFGISNTSWPSAYDDLVRVKTGQYGRMNTGRINDPAMEKKMDEAEATSEINKRIRLRQEVTAHMYENVYLLPLHRQVNVFGMNKRVDFPCRADEKVFAWKVKKVK